MNGKHITTPDVRNLVRRACRDSGGQEEWARSNGMSGAYVCDVIKGRRAPGPKILQALGLEKITLYRRPGP